MEQETMLQRNLQDAAYELVRRHTGRGTDTQEDIAQACGIARGRLSQMLNEPGVPMPMHVAVQLTRVLKDDFLIQAQCAACGGTFVPLSNAPMGPEDGARAFARAMALLGDGMRESGEALAVATEVIRDRVATPVEKRRAEREILEAISELGRLHQAIQEMPERMAPERERF